KNRAAKRNREQGKTQQSESLTDFEPTLEGTQSVSTPLFVTPLPLSRHLLSGIVKPHKKSSSLQWKVPRTAAELAETFRMPFLLPLPRTKLGFGRLVTADNTGFLPIELRSVLQITKELFQTDYLEGIKVRCSPPAHLQGRTLQETVFFDDSPKAYGRFENYAIGRVLSLITVSVPSSAQWHHLPPLPQRSYQNPTIYRLAVM